MKLKDIYPNTAGWHHHANCKVISSSIMVESGDDTIFQFFVKTPQGDSKYTLWCPYGAIYTVCEKTL